jgi:phage-related protein
LNDDTRAVNKSVQEALQIATAVNPKFSLTQCDDLGISTAYFIEESPVTSIFDKILGRWGGELYRDNYNVAIKSR